MVHLSSDDKHASAGQMFFSRPTCNCLQGKCLVLPATSSGLLCSFFTWKQRGQLAAERHKLVLLCEVFRLCAITHLHIICIHKSLPLSAPHPHGKYFQVKKLNQLCACVCVSGCVLVIVDIKWTKIQTHIHTLAFPSSPRVSSLHNK